jgi:hypothetical protein
MVFQVPDVVGHDVFEGRRFTRHQRHANRGKIMTFARAPTHLLRRALHHPCELQIERASNFGVTLLTASRKSRTQVLLWIYGRSPDGMRESVLRSVLLNKRFKRRLNVRMRPVVAATGRVD